jgi:teichuronic acid biosynthesis glycosyltransferase TuaH
VASPDQHAVRSLALVSLENWDDTWRRNQHLCAEFRAQGLVDHITFIEPPLLGHRARRSSPLPGIDVLRPALMVPKRYGGFATVGVVLRATVLRRADAVWVNAPDLGVHCLPAGKPAVYDVTDDWRTFEQAPHVLTRLIAAEDELARRVPTIVCSQILADRWRERYGVEVAVVHNGVDLEAVAKAAPRVLPGEAPHVGYIGTLHGERLDVDLVARLAVSPGIGTVHLVGPDHLGEAGERLRRAGVLIHGPVTSADVPSWMKAMDVLISPHRVTDFTLSLDAIKSYEYLATGRPVVATPTSGFQVLNSPALTCAPAETFIAAVEAAVASKVTYPPDTSCGWDRRAREFADLLASAR